MGSLVELEVHDRRWFEGVVHMMESNEHLLVDRIPAHYLGNFRPTGHRIRHASREKNESLEKERT